MQVVITQGNYWYQHFIDQTFVVTETYGSEGFTVLEGPQQGKFIFVTDCEIVTVENDPKEQIDGIKHDLGKIKAACLRDFALAFKEVAKVASFGAKKYKRSDWLHVDNAIERYSDAQDRHSLELWAGNEIDHESGCLHEAQVIWNALAVLELKLRDKQ